jgi:PTS system fructose-specific IIC component
VAVGLVLVVTNDPVMAPIASQLLAVTLAVVTANELVGPALVKMSLQRTGEAGRDRDRILEFLHEENIIVDLTADTKEQAIRRLLDVLIRTNRLDADRDQLLESVLVRESQASTCLGEGLAVPHAIHDCGERIVGAMGISRKGLDFETPDHLPVHCMVVLATPASKGDRHLQVLAALAHAIATDPNRQRQLYAAATPAHAYEILHADEAQEFNWFVDDDENENENERATAT